MSQHTLGRPMHPPHSPPYLHVPLSCLLVLYGWRGAAHQSRGRPERHTGTPRREGGRARHRQRTGQSSANIAKVAYEAAASAQAPVSYPLMMTR
jgi:hypothetical protein